MAKDDNHRSESGYGRPPKQHQIKRGETRNPFGRKGKPGSNTDFLDEKINMRLDGRIRKVSRAQALDFGLFQEAVKGNVSAVKELERRYKERARASADSKTNEDLSADEQATLDRYIERRLQEARWRTNESVPNDRPEHRNAFDRHSTPAVKK